MSTSNKEILIEPMVFHGPGNCNLCNGPIMVADAEITTMELDENGTPISEETVIRVSGMCMHCKNKTPMIRWKGGYIPVSDSSFILKKMELRDEAMDRVNNCNAISKEDNPFALNIIRR